MKTKFESLSAFLCVLAKDHPIQTDHVGMTHKVGVNLGRRAWDLTQYKLVFHCINFTRNLRLPSQLKSARKYSVVLESRAYCHQETGLHEWFTSDGNFPNLEIRRVCEFSGELFEPDNTLFEPVPTSGLVLKNKFKESQIWVHKSVYFYRLSRNVCFFLSSSKRWITQWPTAFYESSYSSQIISTYHYGWPVCF